MSRRLESSCQAAPSGGRPRGQVATSARSDTPLRRMHLGPRSARGRAKLCGHLAEHPSMMPGPGRHIINPARLALALALLSTAPLAAQGTNTLPSALSTRVGAAITDVISKTQVPSAYVGIVQNGRIVYTAAFGDARLSPHMPATPDMHYAIGSISKQFTVAAVMLLQQEGKLSIDDPVSKWFPELTRAERGHAAQPDVAHLGLRGLRAAGLHDSRRGRSRSSAGEDRPRVGHQAARLRSGHRSTSTATRTSTSSG